MWTVFWYRQTTEWRIWFSMLSFLLSFSKWWWGVVFLFVCLAGWFCSLYYSSYSYFLLLSSVILACEHIVIKLVLCTSILNLLFGSYYSCLGIRILYYTYTYDTYNPIHLSSLEICSKEFFWSVSNALDKEDKVSSVLFLETNRILFLFWLLIGFALSTQTTSSLTSFTLCIYDFHKYWREIWHLNQ